MLLQSAAGGGVVFYTLFCLQLWEELEDFVALLCAQPVDHRLTRLEALGPCPVAQNNIVVVEHKVHIGDTQRPHFIDPFELGEVLGSCEHFCLLKVKRGALVIDQDPVLRADKNVMLWQVVTKSALLDEDRAQVWRASKLMPRKRLLSHPTDFLNAVVPRDDLVTDLEVFHKALAPRCRDRCAGRKARHDVLDFFKGHR